MRQAALLLGCALGAACTMPPEKARPMLPDGKEVIYAYLSEGTVTIADEALGNTWDLGPREQPVTFWPITWNENPADKYWRLLFYGLRPFSSLLYAYYTTGNTEYRDKLVDILRSYTAFDAARPLTPPNPYLDDPHTASFREMMLVNIYGKLTRTGDLPGDLDAPMQASIAKLGTFLADPANFQDGENHGFNESAALLVAAVNFPAMPDASAWQTLALERLGKLMGDAIDSDGVEIEDSPFYHFYVLSAVAQDSTWMHTYGVPLPAGFDATVGNMFSYATYAPMPDGEIPLLGSSVALDVSKLLPKVYDPGSLADMSGVIASATPEFTFVRSEGADGASPTDLNKRFAVSGQSFLRTGFGSNANDFGHPTWMSFNAGVWRSPHCHLDALGITYYSNGTALLPDSGLYEYLVSKMPTADATFFFGTRAHNTVVVDGGDQSNAVDVVKNVTEGLVTGGSANGSAWAYQSASHQLYAGVTHARSVLLLGQDVALVLDRVTSAAPHTYTQTWHLWPAATITTSGLDVAATDGSSSLALTQGMTDGVSLAAIKGQESPVTQGFYSDEYGQKVPNYALEYSTSGAPTATFATLVTSGPMATTPATVHADTDDGGGITTTLCAGKSIALTVVVQGQAQPGESVTVTPGGC